MKDIQDRYIKSFDKKLNEIDNGLINRNFEILRAMGHKLHGSGASYGFAKITEIGKTINSLAKEKKLDDINKQVSILKEYITDLKKQRGII